MSCQKRAAFVLAFCLLLAGAVFGQNFRGTYKMTSGNVTLTLVLDQDASGRISGTLSSTKGTQFRLEGTIEEGIATGTCGEEAGQSFFEAEFEGSKLIFTLTEVNAGGGGNSRSLEFVRAAGNATPAPKPASVKPPSASSDPPAAGSSQGQQQGQRINDAGLGISFVAPAGWMAKKQGEVLLLGSNTHKGFIIIQPHSYTNINQMSQDASEGLTDEESGILLTPASQFQAFGKNGLSGEFAGTVQGVQARAFAVGLISPKGGGGVTILAAVESGSYTTAYPGFVRSIASSLTFSSPQASTSSAGSGATDANLMNYFKGEYYSYSGGSTIYGGAGTERTITLCPDGNYRDSYEFSASGGDWGGATNQRGAARWSIQGSQTQGVITVTYANGQSKQVPYQVLSKSEQTILFDGIKFAFAGAPKCR